MSDGDHSHVTGVDFVCVNASDFDASIAFYAETLGLPELKRWGDMPGVEFQTENLTLAVMEPTAFGQEFRRNGAAIALQVDDVAAAREELESKGVEFHGETIDSGVCHMAFLSDPAGNPLMLHHRYAPKPSG